VVSFVVSWYSGLWHALNKGDLTRPSIPLKAQDPRAFITKAPSTEPPLVHGKRIFFSSFVPHDSFADAKQLKGQISERG
jgi:hypothetical protein